MKTTLEHVAKEKAKQKIEQIVNGEHLRGDASFDEVVERLIESRKSQGRAKNDESFAKAIRKSFHLPMTTPARSIAPGDLMKWLNAQAAAQNWRARTFNHYRLFLRQAFDLAVADNFMLAKDHPFERMQIARKRPDPVRRNIPTQEQFERIIASVREVDGEAEADFLEFLGLAGVGQAEAAALEWSDISGDKIRFVRKKTRREFWVPLFSYLAPLLAKLRQEKAEGLVFSVREAGEELRQACDRLGYKRFTQRGLRAMRIKRWYDDGVPVKRIALWQGHTDGGKLIMETYTEVFCDTDAAAERADLERVGGAIRVDDLALPNKLRVVESAA